MKNNNNARFTDILGILWHDTKDLEGTVVPVFDIKVDTNLFTTRLSRDKLHKACEFSASVLKKQRMTLFEAKTLTGFLSFCAKVVRLC